MSFQMFISLSQCFACTSPAKGARVAVVDKEYVGPEKFAREWGLPSCPVKTKGPSVSTDLCL